MDTTDTLPWVSFDTTVEESPDIAEEILSSLDIQGQDISYISASESLIDRFSYIEGKKRYVLSYAFGNDKRIEAENSFLKLNKSPFCPKIITGGQFNFCGENISYNITSYAYAEPLIENLAFLTENPHLLWGAYKVTSKQRVRCQTPEDYINLYISKWEVTEPLFAHASYNWLIDFAKESFKDLTKYPKKEILSSPNVCHGNLTVNSVSITLGSIQISDWHYCFNGHPLFDVCYFCIGLGMTSSATKELGDKIFGQKLPKTLFKKIFMFALRAFFLKNLTDFCFWAFSKQKSDGFALFIASQNIKSAIGLNECSDVVPNKTKEKLLNLISQVFVEQSDECEAF